MKVSIDIIQRYFAQQGPMVLLESQSKEHPWSQISYLAAAPRASIQARGNEITIKEGKQVKQFQGNPWEAFRQFRKEQGNWVFGYLGYELKDHIENLSSGNYDPVKAPDLYFMVPGFLVKIDHQTGEWEQLRGSMPDIEKMQSAVETVTDSVDIKSLDLRTSRESYIAKIREAQQRIKEGDFYEINLSHQLKGEFTGQPAELYTKMKKAGPVPFGAYIKFGKWVVCCQSPERFLRKEGDKVFSQPIKGTSQRGRSDREDQSLKQQLISSQKEKAENLMIVDLVRNDLSRIARKGSVEVPKLFEIESFDTVHQMVSTVKAEAVEEDPVSILKACFPMGSMTGAPKISAMQTIEELEDYRRGIYSGAIGYITPRQNFDFNVVIRTAIIQEMELYYAVGGAITSDSDPRKEWQETLIKARALVEAVGYTGLDTTG